MPPREARTSDLWRTLLCAALLIASCGPWSSAPLALLAGMVLALVGLTRGVAPLAKWGKPLSRFLIQACIVALGLRLDLTTLAHAAWDGLALAVATIVGAVVCGLALGAWLRSGREASVLVTSGTAICGGSAIAAVGSAIRASSSSMAIATGAVFVLNAAALFLFPPLARLLHLSDHEFGLWAGVAIHDMSSVAGAASAFDKAQLAAGSPSHAVDTANIVKLTRVIWILPLSLAAAWWMHRKAEEREQTAAQSALRTFPWFILWFVGASALRTFVPALDAWKNDIARVASIGFQLALFLIGTGLSLSALRSVGWRVLVQAVVLWVLLAGSTLGVILAKR